MESCRLASPRPLERLLSNGDSVLRYRYFCHVDYGDSLISDRISGVLAELRCPNSHAIAKPVIWRVMVGVFAGEQVVSLQDFASVAVTKVPLADFPLIARLYCCTGAPYARVERVSGILRMGKT